jgi:NADPH2:quinone reductase
VKAVVCKEWGLPELLVIKDIPSRDPGPGEVKIRVKAAGVNFPDVLIIQKKYQLQPTLPFTPGTEIAGEVISVGEGVSHLKPGDRVISFCGIGGYAEEVVAPAKVTSPMPAGISFEIAAGLSLAYGTSWHAVRDRGALQAGETMLVLGAAGGVGLAAIEIGKAIGARVIAAASTDEKLAVCKAHGADEVINYEKEDLREAIKRVNDGKPVNVIYDAVGGKFAEPAIRSLAWRGRYLVVGFASGEIPSIPLNLILLKGSSLVGVFWGEWVQREPGNYLAATKELLAWLKDGKINPLVSRAYSLEEAPKALRDMIERKVTGKVVIIP